MKRWNLIRAWWLLATVLAAGFGGADAIGAQPPPWQGHGRLVVSSNRHYIQHSDGTPFLWLGDTAWALFYKLNREEVRQYLDDRKEKGFNVIQAVGYWYPHGEDGPGPHNAPNAYGHRPFAGGEDDPDTAQPLTLRGGSRNEPNDYWDHADFVVREIRARGMYLALLPCWGRAFINSTFEKSKPTITEADARAYGAFLGKRYRKEPHIIWVIGGDINPTKGVGDRLGTYRAMAESIAQATAGAGLRWNEADPRWGKILMTYHPDGDPFGSSSKFFHSDSWLDVNGIETFRSVDKVLPAVAHNYNLKDPVKPTLLLEGAYEGGRYQGPDSLITELRTRRQAWQAMLAGAAGHTYGASPMWYFQRKPRGTTKEGEWKRALQYAGARQVAKILGDMLTELKWWELVPDQSLLAQGAGEGETVKAAVRTEDGKRIVVYFADSTPARFRAAPAAGSMVTWIRPDTGAKESGAAANSVEFAPPAGWPDAVLVIGAN